MNKKQFWLTAFLSSFTMALIMSGVISLSKMGLSWDWFHSWILSFLIAWPCALLLNLTVLPKVRELSEI
ncbi:DUF2798 domain-containing protein, partial [Vibrio alginolyticus]|nr:DUF2798 domain-containing protein [Vibrio alginolyticus]